MLKGKTIGAVGLAVAGVLLSIGSAHASSSQRCTDRPRAEWMSQDSIATKLKDQGYDVRKIETKRSCYEATVRDAKGQRMELYVNPIDARVVETKVKSDRR